MKTAIIIAKNLELRSVELLRAATDAAGFRVKVSSTLEKADLVINRRYGMDYSDMDLDQLQDLQAFCLNPVSSQRICRDKWLQYNWLRENYFKVCPTWKLGSSPPTEGQWMLKTQRGMQGRGVTKHNTLKELELAIQEAPDQRYIVQKALEFTKEYRCTFIGNETLWFEKQGGNLFMGGSAQKTTMVEKKTRIIAKRIKNGLGLRFGAVDILQFEGEVYPIDINCYPGVELLKEENELLVRMFLDIKESL